MAAATAPVDFTPSDDSSMSTFTIAIASGKGGVGKTTFATVLAAAAAGNGQRVVYVDCDVEAPNGHLLLRPRIEHRHRVTRMVPAVSAQVCRACGTCQETCQFGAIVCLGDGARVYPGLCKSCGACVAACPAGALAEVEQPIGVVETGSIGGLKFIRGVLDVGQARCIPVIQAAQQLVPDDTELAFFDAPPGTSCPMVATARDADLVLLVTEATRFGLADLTCAVDTITSLGLPMAVVINRCDGRDTGVHDFCEERQLPVAAELPYNRALAQAYAQGDLSGMVCALRDIPGRILDFLTQHAQRRAAPCSS
jgi:MinD superfamily P-loop ATPase